jgi:hypothetical protein
MRRLKNVAAIAITLAFLVGLPAVANATPFQIPAPNSDISKNGTGGAQPNANDDASNFFRLQTYGVTPYNAAHPLTPLPTPLFAGALDLGSNDQSAANSLLGFDYAVLHYGKGPGGIGGGGGVEMFYLNGMTSFIFPANGTGPNGFGGFSSLTLFRSVPDGGTTAILLGSALAGLGLLRRYLKN